MRRARELDPLNPLSYALSSQVAFQARDYASALQHANRAIALDQEFWIGHQMRAQALEQLGDTDLALKALATAAGLSGQNSKAISLTGYILGRSGRTAEARDQIPDSAIFSPGAASRRSAREPPKGSSAEARPGSPGACTAGRMDAVPEQRFAQHRRTAGRTHFA